MGSGSAMVHTAGLCALEARRWPAASGRAQRLAVLCHGYSETPSHWTGFVAQAARVAPDMAFVAPQAPHPMPNASQARQWWEYGDKRPGVAETEVRKNALLFTEFVVQELCRTGIPLSACILAGFSQGAMIALHAALRLPSAAAGVLCIAGRLLDPRPSEVSARPPVLLIHGAEDLQVPSEETTRAQALLRAWGCRVEVRMLEGLGHAIDRQVVDIGAEFLGACGRDAR